MKLYIGKYRNWIGPYQLVSCLEYVGVSQDRCDKIGEYLSKTWLNKFLNWIHEFKSRRVYVRIDDYDTWSMDSTLAYIIHPMLVQLKQTKQGSPFVADEDVPEYLRSTSAGAPKDQDGTDELFHQRWEWIMDEMIWAFENLNSEWDEAFYTEPVGKWSLENTGTIDREGMLKVQDRMTNAFRLFGKYYQNLWD